MINGSKYVLEYVDTTTLYVALLFSSFRFAQNLFLRTV